MKMISKVLLTAAAIAALAAPAMAADKLIVKDAAGTADVFKVDDTGKISGTGLTFNQATGKYGFGTTNPATSLHMSEASNPFDRGFTITQFGNHKGGATINIKKAQGTEGIPTLPDGTGAGSVIGAFHGFVYDGNTNIANANGWSANASLLFFTEPGTYSVGNVPSGFRFETGIGQLVRLERLRITSDGRIRVSNQPAAPANNATCTVGDQILDAPNGFLYLCVGANSWKRASFTAY